MPAIARRSAQDGGGEPTRLAHPVSRHAAGYEFISLVQAILLVGGAGSTLTDDNRRRIAAVDRPVTMQVFTTPT